MKYCVAESFPSICMGTDAEFSKVSDDLQFKSTLLVSLGRMWERTVGMYRVFSPPTGTRYILHSLAKGKDYYSSAVSLDVILVIDTFMNSFALNCDWMRFF